MHPERARVVPEQEVGHARVLRRTVATQLAADLKTVATDVGAVLVSPARCPAPRSLPSARKRHSFLSAFPYVCPEPVLVK